MFKKWYVWIPEHPLLITINRENFILLWGFEINRKYIDFRAEKINRKNGFSKVKINREFLYFSLFFVLPSAFDVSIDFKSETLV